MSAPSGSLLVTQELVAAIQSVLAVHDESDPVRLRELAVGLRESTQRVSDRAAECGRLWEAARHDEARQLARRGGDLREELGLLEFPEAEAWGALCARHELPETSQLRRATLRPLLDALYGAPGALEKLLAKHRRFAIGRAAVADRLRVLRTIAQLQPERREWREDQRLLEAARQAELAEEAALAEREADRECLEGILRELRGDDWEEPVAPGLLRQVQEALQPLLEQRAEARFSRLAEDIRAAHSSLDEARCRELLDRWAGVLGETGCAAESSLAAEIEPAQAWLRELREERGAEAEFQRACGALERVVDEVEEPAEIERELAAVLRFERPVPAVLMARCSSRLRELERDARRRFALRLAGVFGLVLLIAAGVGTAWWRIARERTLVRWEAQLAQLLDEGELEGAGLLLAQLRSEDPGLHESPEIQRLEARHEEALGVDAQRRRQLAQLFAELDERGVEDPGFPRLLARVQTLARAPGEQGRVEDWRQRHQLHQDAVRQRVEDAASARLARLEASFAALRRRFAAGEPLGNAADEALALAQSLARAEGAPTAGQERAQTIAEAIVQLTREQLEAGERQDAVRRSLTRIAGLARDPDALLAALEAFATASPAHPFSADFLQVAAQAELWRGAASWALLVDTWSGSLHVHTSKAAEFRLTAARDLVKRYPRVRELTRAPAALDYLQAARSAWRSGGFRGLEAVTRLLGNPLLADVYVLDDGAGGRYYLPDSRLKSADAQRFSFEHFLDAAGKTAHESLPVRGRRAPRPRLAPQVALSREAFREVKGWEGVGWETLYLRLAELVQAHPDIDAVLRATLLQLFLRLAAETTPHAQEQVRALGRELATVDLNVSWMDPSDREAARLRQRMERLLGELEGIAGARARVEAWLAEPMALRPLAVHLPGRPLELLFRAKQGELFAIVVASGSSAAFTRIGEIVAGEPRLDAIQAASLRAGTVLFCEARP